MKRRIVVHPGGRPGLLDSHGIGAPRTIPGGTPVHPVIPRPTLPDPVAGATKNISDALGAAMQKFVRDVLPAGEVLLGAVLLVVGLLLATGLAGKGAKLTPAGRVATLAGTIK